MTDTLQHKVTKCRSCGQAIFFAKTSKGKIMPVNHPSAEKRLTMFGGILYNEPVYISHFATCPNAAKHRGIK